MADRDHETALLTAHQEEPRLPQLRHALGFYVALWVVLIVGALFVFALLESIGVKLDPNGQPFTIVATLAQMLFTIGLIWVFLQGGRFNARATLSLRRCSLGVFFWAAVGIVPLGMLTGQVAQYLVRAVPSLMSEGLLEMVRLSRFGEVGLYALFALAISLGPGISEELAFRGFILRGLLARLKPWQAITFSASLFALFHLDPLHMILAFPAGLYLGFLVVRTRSLYPAVVAHAFNNLWSTLEAGLWQLARPDIDPAKIILSTAYPPLIVGPAALLLIVSLHALRRLSPPP